METKQGKLRANDYGYDCKVRNSKRVKKSESKDRTCCRSLTFFMFSHMGVGLIVICYAIVGAFAFRALEYVEPVSFEKKQDLLKIRSNALLHARSEVVETLWNVTRKFNVLFDQNWTERVTKEIEMFQRRVIRLVGDDAVSDEDKTGHINWTFVDAFLYSLTIITTIGYGGTSPRTTWGKLGTIIYAILGIPLMLLYLTNLGDIFARCFTIIYTKLCTRRSMNSRDEIYRAHYVSGSPSTNCKYYTANNCPTRHLQKDGDLRHFHVLSNNGSDVDSPRHQLTQIDEECQLERIPDELQRDLDIHSSKVNLTHCSRRPESGVGPVPIILCLFVLLTYVLGGAAVFSYLESWSYIEGIYFSFVTLTTIGFGDLSLNDQTGSRVTLVVYSAYLLIGMAIIAMCFNLIQQQFSPKHLKSDVNHHDEAC